MKIDEIKTIEHYTTAYDLFLNCFFDELSNLTKAERDYLKGVDDYEYFDYYVVNEETVITAESGIAVQTDSLEAFLAGTLEYLRSEAE